jgi:asparagine synthase (glutamine-hydrolysing)
MCGIVGLLSQGDPADRDKLIRMRDTMTHRGPDDSGVWWSRNRRMGLGHRRLAIIDLSPGGHQPMQDTTGRYTIVFNGEIYNYQSLRDDLQHHGEVFRSQSDTEVLLTAYRIWGEDCLSHLDGMFSFAIYDATDDSLFLARDRAGEKPLYYRTDPQRFAFASELKALMADSTLPRRMDLSSVNFYLAYGYIPGERCILEGVRKLPPGCAMKVDCNTGKQRVWRYWDLPAPTAPASVSPDDLRDRLHELLRESVRRRLIADVPVGVLLSGGIDSSLITAVAAEVSNQPVRTFTISFPGHGRYDEAPHAQQVASHFGTHHTVLECPPTSYELLPELAEQYDEPMADYSMLPTFMLSKLIRRHATVALGGDGGDELFGGYPGHRWVQTMQAIRRFCPRWFRRGLTGTAERLYRPGRKGRNAVLGFLADAPESLARINTYFDLAQRRRLLGFKATKLDLQAPEQYKISLQPAKADLLQQITAMDFRSYLPEDILVKVDRASMLASLEIRAPFLSQSLIEFAFAELPSRYRATRNEGKILPRALAEKLLPASLDLRRKQGFTPPLQSWFQGDFGSYCKSVLLDEPNELVDRASVERYFEEQSHGRVHTQRIFALTMLALWQNCYAPTP